MIFQIKSYLKFLWNSSNEHGVHSPFVFSLVTKCFYDKTKYWEYENLRNHRKSLLENKNTIEVTDFGAGSRVFKSNTRQISKIAKTAGITPKRAELLFRIVNYFQPENILEIGTSLGLATHALAIGNPNAKTTTLEGCANTSLEAQKYFNNLFMGAAGRDYSYPKPKVNFIVTEFTEYFKNSQLNTEHFQLIYFDGNHSKKATLEYFELLLPTITNDTVWIFDDIHWSEEMEEAWEAIKQHPKVKVTIDTFQWGLVFFRYEQQKEHFIIRT